jgi:ribosomal-protein-alanine N-acetyltransferase
MDTVIATERCRLQFSLSEAERLRDSEAIWTASRVPGFTDGMLWEPPATKEEIVARFPLMKEQWEAGACYCFTITDTEHPERCIGRIDIRLTDKPGILSIGYWIHPDAHRQGYAREAAKAIVDFGFRTLEVQEIEAASATWNTGSQRVLAGIGMTVRRTNPRGFFKKGQWVEEDEYSITQEEWLAQQQQ